MSLTSHNTPSLAAEREVPPIPLPHNARTQLSDECDLSSIRGSQSAFSLTQLTQRSEGVGAGAGVCRKCQGKSSVTARTVEVSKWSLLVSYSVLPPVLIDSFNALFSS